MTERMTGTVKWFNTNKGFGFISAKDNGDIFVHYSDIESEGFKNLSEGQLVEFSVENGGKGLRAKNVVILE